MSQNGEALPKAECPQWVEKRTLAFASDVDVDAGSKQAFSRQSTVAGGGWWHADCSFAHFGLRTRSLPAAIEWYGKVLGAQVRFRNELAAFMSFDDETTVSTVQRGR